MLKALLPVDGSGHSLGAVKHVIKLFKDREPLEIHLLNVQPPMHHDVTMFISGDAVKDYHKDEGHKALAEARQLLDASGVPYASHVVVGHIAEAITAWASRLDCDKVVMGTRGHGAVTHLLLGSVTHKTIHLMPAGIPVTLVKQDYHAPEAR